MTQHLESNVLSLIDHHLWDSKYLRIFKWDDCYSIDLFLVGHMFFYDLFWDDIFFFIIMLILRLILIHIVPYLILKLLNNLFSANDFLGSMLNCIHNKFILTNYIIKSWVNYNRKFKTQICLFAITLCWCNYDMNFLVNIKTTPFFQ